MKTQGCQYRQEGKALERFKLCIMRVFENYQPFSAKVLSDTKYNYILIIEACNAADKG